MQIVMVRVDQLKVDNKNRNKHSKAQIKELAKLIEFQGFRVPIIVSNQDGSIKAGHGRLMAAQALGLKEVPVIYQDFESDEQAYAFQIAENAIGKWAELDYSAINTDLIDLGPDIGVDLLGIEDFELEPADKEPKAEKKAKKVKRCPHCEREI